MEVEVQWPGVHVGQHVNQPRKLNKCTDSSLFANMMFMYTRLEHDCFLT